MPKIISLYGQAGSGKSYVIFDFIKRATAMGKTCRLITDDMQIYLNLIKKIPEDKREPFRKLKVDKRGESLTTFSLITYLKQRENFFDKSEFVIFDTIEDSLSDIVLIPWSAFGCQYIIKTEQLSRNGDIDDVISDVVLKCYKTDIKDNEIHIDKISCKENNENINFIDVITINKGNFEV